MEMRGGTAVLTNGVEIEIWSDVVCPWCYIGKARLEQAVAAYPGEVTLRWRAFQLDPGATSDGRPLVESLAGKFGGPERVRQIIASTTETAAADGLDLHFHDAVSANTFDAHRLIWFAQQQGRQAELVNALHAAHFTHGRDLGSRAVLAEIAAEHGLDAERFLDSDAGSAEVAADLQEAAELGVSSVPTFVINGRYAVSGAQPVEVFSQVLAEVDRLATADA
jgi:predicted DsbA family dithiol-disulfide isomerase